MGKSLDGKELGKGISQRKDGTYCARYYNRLGKRKCVYDKNLRKVKQKRKKAIQEDKDKVNLEYDYTLNEWFDFWFENYKKKDGMSLRYLESVKRYYELYVRSKGNVDITKFRNIDALKCVKEALEQSKTAGESVRHILNQMLDKAYLNDIVSRNVAKGIDTQSRNSKIKTPLSKKDEEMIIKNCKQQIHKDMIEFDINTGLRLSELIGLSFDEVDLDKKVLFIKHQLSDMVDEDGEYYFIPTKTRSERIVPLNEKSIKILKRNIELREKQLADGTHNRYRRMHSTISKELIFVNNKGECYTRTGFYSILKYIEEFALEEGYAYDCKNISPHTFRHTFATRCINAGMAPNTVSAILGHTSIRMTLHYVHNSLDQFNKDISLIDQI